MKRAVIAVLALWTLPGMPAVGAPDDPNKVQAESKKTPKEQFQAVLEAYEQAGRDFRQAYSKAKTDEERSKIFSETYPKTDDEYARRFLAIADAAPDDPAAVDALIWYIRLGRGGDTSKAMKRLAEKHAADPKLARVVSAIAIAHSNSPSGEELLRAVIEKNRDRTARGNATMALAQFLKKRFDLIAALGGNDERSRQIEQRLTSMEGYDKSALARLKATDSTALAKEIESLFERVVKEFGDINAGRATLGKQAEGELNEIRNLGIGRPCPEIAGEDIDGKPFKLSDYKGKVVVVDFWGDW
jgi:hypothetical protein